MFKLSGKRGFSMFELLIVIAFMAIMGAVGIGYYFTYYRQTILNSEADQVKAFLYSTQQKSIGQQDGAMWGVHFENPVGSGAFYASFKGTDYATGTKVETRYLDNSLTFDYPTSGNSFDIVFSKINGSPGDTYKKVYVQLKGDGSDRAIRVSPVGIISLDNGEVGWWKLDETSGTSVTDATIFRSDGVVTGTPAWQTSANCKRGGCFSFSTGNYITIGDLSPLKNTGSQTIAMWLKPMSFATRQNPYAKAYGGEGTITQETNGALNYYYGTYGGNSSPYQGFGSTVIPLNQWSHVAIVRDLTGMKLKWYINGKMTTSTTASYASATASTLPAYIGHGYTNDYVGVIDDVRVYDRALSDAEVNNLFQTTK